MDSILKQQLSRLTESEIQEKLNIVKSNINKLLDSSLEYDIVSYLNNLNRLRRKYTNMLHIINELGYFFNDDDFVQSILNKIVAIAQENKINPLEIGETFESLGVTQPWEFKDTVSVVDKQFQDTKEFMKRKGMEYIKNNPFCSESDLYTYLDNNYNLVQSATAKFLLKVYQNGAYERGLISNNTFEDFRDFVVNTPIETLLSL